MRARLLIGLALGAVLGGVFGGTAILHLTGPRELEFPHVVRGPEKVRVLVAKRELPYGTEIAPKDLQWVQWPKATVPPGAFTSVDALLGEKGTEARRTVLRTIEPGEPVLESKITKLGESPPMERNLGDGRRAVQIRVDAAAGVAGFVEPGDRVDIMLIRKIEDQLVSSIIMQDVRVIEVGSRSGDASEERDSRTITVDVDITEAQKLVLAQQVGRLSLTLRGIREEKEEFRYVPPALEPCPRPWSGYRDIPENILIPNLCHAGLDGIIGPSLRPQGPPVRVRRGDFGVPRGLCDVPPNAPPGGTLCDAMDFPPWESAGPSVRVRRGGSLGETGGP